MADRAITMREFVDAQQGAGAWDRMHDLIDRKEIFGWRMPDIEVDGVTVSIFPGTNREVTLDEVKEEIRKVFNAPHGDPVDDVDDLPPASGERG